MIELKEEIYMDHAKFLELQQKHGEFLVYQDSEGFTFTIGDIEDEQECFALQDKYGYNGDFTKGPCFYIGYGDDYCNAVVVKKLEDMTKEVEDFVVKNIGVNCYCDEFGEEEE